MKDIETLISKISVDNLDRLLSYMKYSDSFYVIIDLVEQNEELVKNTLKIGDVNIYGLYHHFMKNLLIYITKGAVYSDKFFIKKVERVTMSTNNIHRVKQILSIIVYTQADLDELYKYQCRLVKKRELFFKRLVNGPYDISIITI